MIKASAVTRQRSGPPPRRADEDDLAEEGLVGGAPSTGDDLAEDELEDLLMEDGVVQTDAISQRAVCTARAGPCAAAADEAQLAAWIDRIVERDEQALTALYDATLPRVYGLVLRIVRKPQLAEEVVEEAFFQVWRQAVRFDATRGRAWAWLLGMARSRAIDALRHEARHQHDSLDAQEQPERAAEQPGTDELLELARSHADLHRALMRLSAQPRQLVALAFFRGLSHEEIASQTELPLGTVKSQIRRALMSLREQLGDAATPCSTALAS